MDWLAKLFCQHHFTWRDKGELRCKACGKVQMIMVAPSGRTLVEWVKP